jgi:hypothetical protein
LIGEKKLAEHLIFLIRRLSKPRFQICGDEPRAENTSEHEGRIDTLWGAAWKRGSSV